MSLGINVVKLGTLMHSVYAYTDNVYCVNGERCTHNMLVLMNVLSKIYVHFFVQSSGGNTVIVFTV